MTRKKLVSLALILAIVISLFSPVALAGTYEDIYAINEAMHSSASTGDNARRYYLMPSDNVESDNEKIIERAKKITAGLSDDLAKAHAIHDWVCNNVWYDYDWLALEIEHPDKSAAEQSAVRTMERGYAVCQGYTNLTIALLRAVEIPAKEAEGRAAEEYGGFTSKDIEADTNHAWAEALIDGKWIIIDTTWDSGNARENGQKTSSMGLIDHTYFNPTLSSLSKDHRTDSYLPYFGAEIENGELITYGGFGDDLPEEITRIGKYAFYECNNLIRVTIPYGVEVIGYAAFGYSHSLTKVSLPTSVTTFEDFAFYDCSSLEDIHIPNGTVSIGAAAFLNCAELKSVYIPPTVTDIGFYAFESCSSLQSIIIPASVKSIGITAFGYNLKSLNDTFYYGTPIPIEGFTIYGAAGSAAETYAKDNGFTFIQLKAIPTNSDVFVDGESVSFDAYNIAGNNFFKLRDLAYILSGTDAQFNVTWDEGNNAISLVSGASYIPVGGEMGAKSAETKLPDPTTSKIYLDGKPVSLASYNIGGNNYFKLRDIGAAFGFVVDWDDVNNAVIIETGGVGVAA